jgi:hypothetical protein
MSQSGQSAKQVVSWKLPENPLCSSAGPTTFVTRREVSDSDAKIVNRIFRDLNGAGKQRGADGF